MSLPKFETLKVMAERNEGELEALLQAEIDIILQNVSPEQRRKLLGLQFKINCQKELSHNSVDCCIRLSNMLYLYCQQMRLTLEEFQLNRTVSSSVEIIEKAGGVVHLPLSSSLDDDEAP